MHAAASAIRQLDAAPPDTDRLSHRAHATRLVAGALGLGLAGDLLLRGGIPGVGFSLWLLALIVGLHVLTMHQRPVNVAQWYALMGAAMAVAVIPMWRDSEALAPLAILALLVGAVVLLSLKRGSPIHSVADASPEDAIHAALGTVASVATGPGVLLREVHVDRMRTSRYMGVLRGTAIALPLLAIFAALFASADPTFQALAERLELDPGSVVGHVMLTFVFAWGIAGALRYATQGAERAPASSTWRPLDVTEIGVLFGSLGALFTVFVALQLPRMFAGESYVIDQTGLTFAEYARRGFFEMIVASGLALVIVTGAEAFVRQTPAALRIFRMLGGLLIALVLVILQSAVHRLGLYVDAYGWTLDRLYATGVIVWLALTLAWALSTLVAARPRRFLIGAGTSGIAVLLSMAALNPEAFVVRANAARIETGRSFDLRYLAWDMGRDAVPAMAALTGHIPESSISEESCVAMRRYVERTEAPSDWRRWTAGAVGARGQHGRLQAWFDANCAARLQEMERRKKASSTESRK